MPAEATQAAVGFRVKSGWATAVLLAGKNPAQYGLDSVIKDKPVAYDTLKIDYPIDLRLVAECVDATAEDLSDLNPSLLRMTTPKFSEKGEQFELRLPAGTAAKFQIAVAAIPTDKRVWWRYHKVQAGETLAAIAHTYHTSPKAIAEANDLNDEMNNGVVQPESRLIIPIAPGKQADTSTYARATMRYKIRKGDTVESVAENFGVSAKMVRGWNHLKGSSLAGRKVLYLHLPVTRQAGETQLASKHSSSRSSKSKPCRDEACSVSAASRAHHRTGTQATGSQATATQAAGTRTAAATHPTVTRHKVKPGETLYSIANSYNTTVAALKHDNRIATLRPGMILVVHDPR